jgi:hypothetical protein
LYFADQEAVAIEQPNYQGKIDKRVNAVTPVSVSIVNVNYSNITGNLSFQVSVKFFGNVQGDYRLSTYLTENNVYGNPSDSTVNGYNQLSGFYNVPSSQYYQKGYYSPANNAWVLDAWRYKHQNVLTYTFEGPFGYSLPLNFNTSGQVCLQVYTLTVPTSTGNVHKFYPDNMYIVSFVTEHNADVNKRNILNVAKVKITPNAEVIGLQERQGDAALGVYPNPASEKIVVNYHNKQGETKVQMFDIHGKMVLAGIIIAGENSCEMDVSKLARGVYILKVSAGSEVLTRKVILSHSR